jgi:hypothetical protein
MYSEDEDELRQQVLWQRRQEREMAQHPDPRDPDYPDQEEE